VVFNVLPLSTYCHPQYTTTSGPVLYSIIYVMTQRWTMFGWTEN